MNIKNFIKISILFVIILLPMIIFAEESGQIVPLENLPGFEDVYEPLSRGDFTPYVQGMLNLLIGISATLAVIYIALGGIQYITTDSIGGKEDGKDKIKTSLLGLILILSSWLILVTINPNLIQFQLNLDESINLEGSGDLLGRQPTSYELHSEVYEFNETKKKNFNIDSDDRLAEIKRECLNWQTVERASIHDTDNQLAQGGKSPDTCLVIKNPWWSSKHVTGSVRIYTLSLSENKSFDSIKNCRDRREEIVKLTLNFLGASREKFVLREYKACTPIYEE